MKSQSRAVSARPLFARGSSVGHAKRARPLKTNPTRLRPVHHPSKKPATKTNNMAAATSSATVRDGDWILLSLSSGDRRVVRARKGSKTNAGKGMVSMDPFIGAPFGANFRVEPRDLVRDSRTVEELAAGGGELADAVTATVGDGSSNAELFDDGKAQQLSDADIQRLKREGTHGADLVKAIAASSATFAGKTAFAQEKYLKKKAKKHMPFVSVLRPSPLTLCDLYMIKGPEKLLGLRRDTLALMLTLSNLQEGSRVLVLEQTLGLLAAAATQAVGAGGRVLALSTAGNRPPPLDCVPYLNLPAHEGSALKSASLVDLLSLPPLAAPPASSADTDNGTGELASAATEPDAKRRRTEEAPAESEGGAGAATTEEQGGGSSNTPAGGGASSQAEGGSSKPGAMIRDAAALARDAERGYTCLLVATKESPAPAMLALLGRLVPGSPFAIYHASPQPLAECFQLALQAKAAVRMQLVESFTRKYQVAENRTHPEMNTYPPTGYVLSGVAVLPP